MFIDFNKETYKITGYYLENNKEESLKEIPENIYNYIRTLEQISDTYITKEALELNLLDKEIYFKTKETKLKGESPIKALERQVLELQTFIVEQNYNNLLQTGGMKNAL